MLTRYRIPALFLALLATSASCAGCGQAPPASPSPGEAPTAAKAVTPAEAPAQAAKAAAPAEAPAQAAKAAAPAEASADSLASPPAQAAAEPAQALPPAAEHHFSLCAVSPDTATGLRTLDAIGLEGRPDTLALVDGRRLPLGEAVGRLTLAGQTDWFAAKQPLTLAFGARLQRYQIYDVGRVIEPTDLAYLGTVQGLPVYAAAADVAPVRAELAAGLASERELPRLLASSAALRAGLAGIEVLYVPLRATGCIFQPLLRTQMP